MDAIDKINRLLSEQGITGADLCRALDLSTGVYSQWNKRRTKPSRKTLKQIANYFNVPVSHFENEDKQKEKPTHEGEQLPEITMKLIERIKRMDMDQQAATLLLLNSLDKQEG